MVPALGNTREAGHFPFAGKPRSPGAHTGTAPPLKGTRPLQGSFLPRGVLALEGEMVCDHGDELAIRGFSLDAADGIAEELLQSLHVAAVPGHLDGTACQVIDSTS